MIYNPVITTGNKFLSITMPGITYQQFCNSLGQFDYKVGKMMVTAITLAQIFEIMQYNHFNADGNKHSESIVPNPDPYQYQASIEIALGNVILDGRSNISMNILPNENIQLILKTDEVSYSELLDFYRKSNIKKVIDEKE
jgi:hypothetical protein